MDEGTNGGIWKDVCFEPRIITEWPQAADGFPPYINDTWFEADLFPYHEAYFNRQLPEFPKFYLFSNWVFLGIFGVLAVVTGAIL